MAQSGRRGTVETARAQQKGALEHTFDTVAQVIDKHKMSKELDRAISEYNAYIERHGIDEGVLRAYVQAAQTAYAEEADCAREVSGRAKALIDEYVQSITGGGVWDLEAYGHEHGVRYSLVEDYYTVLFAEARDKVESFALYLEKNRPPEERFYLPRINPQRRVMEAIQALADDEIDELFVNEPSRVGKTQTVKLGFLWWGSRNTEKSNLYTAYSGKITQAFYDGILEIIGDSTYTYAEIFPENCAEPPMIDGMNLTIDLGRKKAYPTFTMRSIHGTLNGACDCAGLAVADDLFCGIEEALSLERQENVWTIYDNNFMRRLKRKAKLINMGTRWAPGDVQGRRRSLLANVSEYAGRRWREIVIPALDENDESNFDYPYDLGYSTSDYLMVRASFEENDDIESWSSQCMQEPIERHGALFTPKHMRQFNPECDLPDRVPDRIFAAVDPAFGAGDYVAMPICYQYDQEYYIVDAVFNDGDKTITVPEVTRRIAGHLDKWPGKTAEVHFEETKATDGYRMMCETEWDKLGVAVNSTHSPAYSVLSKTDRIKNHAPDIRKLFFRDMTHRDREYAKFYQNLLSFKTASKHKHDDAADSIAQLCDMIYGERRTRAKASAVRNPFWG